MHHKSPREIERETGISRSSVLNCRSLDNLLLLMYGQFNPSCAKNI